MKVAELEEAEVAEKVWELVQAIKNVSEDEVEQQQHALRVATFLLMAFTSSAYEAIGASVVVKQCLLDLLEQMNKGRR